MRGTYNMIHNTERETIVAQAHNHTIAGVR